MGGGLGLSELAGGLAGRRAGRLAASRVFLRVHVCVRASLTSFFWSTHAHQRRKASRLDRAR